MGLMQQIELRPLGHGQETIFLVTACQPEGGFIPACQPGGNFGVSFIDRLYQLFRRLVQEFGKTGVLVCYIALEYGGFFLPDPLYTVEKYGLIGCQMGDVLKGTPFARVGMFF